MEEKSASALAPVIEVIPVSSREYGFTEKYFGRIEDFLEGCGSFGRTCEQLTPAVNGIIDGSP
jgi:hypothetical protein